MVRLYFWTVFLNFALDRFRAASSEWATRVKKSRTICASVVFLSMAIFRTFLTISSSIFRVIFMFKLHSLTTSHIICDNLDYEKEKISFLVQQSLEAYFLHFMAGTSPIIVCPATLRKQL